MPDYLVKQPQVAAWESSRQGEALTFWGKFGAWLGGLEGAAKRDAPVDADAAGAIQWVEDAKDICFQRQHQVELLLEMNSGLQARINETTKDWVSTLTDLKEDLNKGTISRAEYEQRVEEHNTTIKTLEDFKRRTWAYMEGIENAQMEECKLQIQRVSNHKTWKTLRPSAQTAAAKLRPYPTKFHGGFVYRRDTLRAPVTKLIKGCNDCIAFERAKTGRVRAFAATDIDKYLGKLPPAPPA